MRSDACEMPLLCPALRVPLSHDNVSEEDTTLRNAALLWAVYGNFLGSGNFSPFVPPVVVDPSGCSWSGSPGKGEH